jgi:hypothetical protein
MSNSTLPREALSKQELGGSLSAARALLGTVGLVVGILGVGACSSDEGEGPYADWSSLPELVDPDEELKSLPQRQAAFRNLCQKGHNDPFARALCSEGAPPKIRSLQELLQLVGLGREDQRAFALTGNSTSVVGHQVSAINPRMIVFPRVESDLVPPEELIIASFVRGEQFVELVAGNFDTRQLTFYVIAFEQGCNYVGMGCDLASLLTEEVEENWTAYSVYDHLDLKTTSLDCLSCHQVGTEESDLILRMQELEAPWLHWFPQRLGQRTESDRVLLGQFAEAHQHDKNYGGIAVSTITNAVSEGSGAQLEALIRAEGFAEQPNPFAGQIAAEFKSGMSPTWDLRFSVHLAGEAIAVPYPGVDITDTEKRAAAVQSYLEVVQERAPRESLVDIRDVFSEDADRRLGFVSWSESDGRAILTQMCARCHDGRGDPDIAKNRFNVLQLDTMTRVEKDHAIERILATDLLQMPPKRAGRLSPGAMEAALTELER